MERKVLIVFDDMIADVEANSRLSPIVTKLLLRGRKLNISPAFISHSYFKTFKTIRIIATHYFIMKIPNLANICLGLQDAFSVTIFFASKTSSRSLEDMSSRRLGVKQNVYC